MSLLANHFVPRDQELIKAVPLSETGATDKIIWSQTPNGKFSVKSAYYLAKKERSCANKNGNAGSTGYYTEESYAWKKVWGT